MGTMGAPDHGPIIDLVSQRCHDQPLMVNVWRGVYVECMVALALGGTWRQSDDGWSHWDLEHIATRAWMEIKQSARQQQPQPGYDGEAKSPSFSIARKQEVWNPGRAVLPRPQRVADLYLFAWHPVVGARADHRRTDQWRFHVLAESVLADQKSIALPPLEELAPSVSHDELPEAVEEARLGLVGLKRSCFLRQSVKVYFTP